MQCACHRACLPPQGKCWCEPTACVVVQSSGWQRGAPAFAKSHLLHSRCQWPQTESTFAAFQTDFLPCSCWCCAYMTKDVHIDKVVHFPLQREHCRRSLQARCTLFFFYVRVDCIGNELVLRNGLICRLPIEWQSWRLSWRRAISVTYDVKAATAGYSSNSSILITAHCSLVEVGGKSILQATLTPQRKALVKPQTYCDCLPFWF